MNHKEFVQNSFQQSPQYKQMSVLNSNAFPGYSDNMN